LSFRDQNPGEDNEKALISEEFVLVRAVESSHSALVRLNRAKKEKELVATLSKQMQDAGACRMLVKVDEIS
jgi:hypothetical protein